MIIDKKAELVETRALSFRRRKNIPSYENNRTRNKEENTMTYFEQKGVNFQYDSCNLAMAQKRFEWSCTLCCQQGKHINCDHCAIYSAHKFMRTVLEHPTKVE